MPCGGAVGSCMRDKSQGRETQVLPAEHLCVGRGWLPGDVTRTVQKLSWVRRGTQEDRPAPAFTPSSQNGRVPSWDSTRRALTQRSAWLAGARWASAVPLGCPFLPEKTSDSFQIEGADYLEGRKNTGDTSGSLDDRGVLPEELRGEL